MSSDTPASNHGANILRQSIADKHAVHDVEDVAGGPKDVENVDTLISLIGRNRFGDLAPPPGEYWSVYDSLAEIREFQSSEDE